MDPVENANRGSQVPAELPSLSPHGVFSSCPQCDGLMQPEHAHYRCRHCGWRDSCCD